MIETQYLVVGAGPAGVQMGYFLERAQRDYVVIEKAEIAGSFFAEQPRCRRLISINKVHNFYDEIDFNLRHDWNSLLSEEHEPLFTEFSDKLYPHADRIVEYLAAFVAKHSIKIQFGCEVLRVQRGTQRRYRVVCSEDRVYECDTLLMATGATKPHVPREIEGIELSKGYEDLVLDKEPYRNKRVAILGRGNSAFEIANWLADTAAYVHILVTAPVKHAWESHFVGDLRAVNNDILDMYQLKSLHATIGFRMRKLERRADGTLLASMEEELPDWEVPGTQYTTVTYDEVIRCTGWLYCSPEIFDDEINPATWAPRPIHRKHADPESKYPTLSTIWESSVPNLFYIGTAMQSRDRRAASGFIHGFRYNIRTLHNFLEHRDFDVPLPGDELPRDLDALGTYVTKRVSTTSALYQQNSFLCDVIEIPDSGPLRCISEIPLLEAQTPKEIPLANRRVVVTLEYGFHKYGMQAPAIDFIHPADAWDTSCAAFLHPVLRYYEGEECKGEKHLGESLVVRYDVYDYEENDSNSHLNAVKNFFNAYLELTDETFSEDPYPKELIETVFRPWTAEEIKQWDEDHEPLAPDCHLRNRG